MQLAADASDPLSPSLTEGLLQLTLKEGRTWACVACWSGSGLPFRPVGNAMNSPRPKQAASGCPILPLISVSPAAVRLVCWCDLCPAASDCVEAVT